MSLTTHDLWWEDRRQFLHRVWHRVWWISVHLLVAAGVLGALVTWGLLVTSVVALALAGISVGLSFPFRSREQAPGSRATLRVAANGGCATVAALGLLAVGAGWGLLLMLVLTAASPLAYRNLRDSSTVVRVSLAMLREMSADAPPACGPDRP